MMKGFATGVARISLQDSRALRNIKFGSAFPAVKLQIIRESSIFRFSTFNQKFRFGRNKLDAVPKPGSFLLNFKNRNLLEKFPRFSEKRYYDHEEYHYRQDPYVRANIKKLAPILFSVGFIGTVTGVCAYMYLERMEKEVKTLPLYGGWQGLLWNQVEYDPKEFGSREEYRSAMQKLYHLIPDSHNFFNPEHKRALLKIAQFPDWVPLELKKIFIIGADSWYSLPDAKKTTYALVGINLVVFAMWKSKRLQGFMMRNFAHDPVSSRHYTMVTSTFSHNQLWHLGFNMLALSSFAPTILSVMPTEEFIAFYLGAGVFSSLISHLASALLKSRMILPSLGASGALYAVLAATAYYYPNVQVSIMLLPFPFNIVDVVYGVVGFDLVMALLGKSIFDHYAHLGGALYGYSYCKFGHEEVWVRALRLINDLKHTPSN